MFALGTWIAEVHISLLNVHESISVSFVFCVKFKVLLRICFGYDPSHFHCVRFLKFHYDYLALTRFILISGKFKFENASYLVVQEKGILVFILLLVCLRAWLCVLSLVDNDDIHVHFSVDFVTVFLYTSQFPCLCPM